MSKPTTDLVLNDLEYLEAPGIDVMLAHDFYPEGHQGGVGVILNGRRVATNGDVRLEPTPGQWSPIPKVGKREVDRTTGAISVRMEYPDEARNRKGFNPIEYPDLRFAYRLSVIPVGRAFHIEVELETPLPTEWLGKVGLNIELFPGFLFGRTYLMDGRPGLFPRQANGPVGQPYAVGRRLMVAPETADQRLAIEVLHGGDLELLDGRFQHNNGWFVVRSSIPSDGRTVWLVTPEPIPGWRSKPVIQTSQVGYHPNLKKQAVIQTDRRDDDVHPVSIFRVTDEGRQLVLEGQPEVWGRFLRYRYLRCDFTSVREPGLYVVQYAGVETAPFLIDAQIYKRHVWQPTVDTFLPVQMCHVRVNDHYRCWHGACHLDDAKMAPLDFNHVDGYRQGCQTLCAYNPEDVVPGLDRGGWHDAGDNDLRIESQSDTVWGLALAYEEFKLDYDNTTIDQEHRVVELQRPDGKPDVLQQIEHGLLWILGGYRLTGRIPRGVIERSMRQYVHLGDAQTITDNVQSDDDRWMFTENSPYRAFQTAAALAAASRVLHTYDANLAQESLQAAIKLVDETQTNDPSQRFAAAIELLIATGDDRYQSILLDAVDKACERPEWFGWLLARSLSLIDQPDCQNKIEKVLNQYQVKVREVEAKTPYGVPYEPSIWGAGWGIQRFGFQQYWLHKARPDRFSTDLMMNAIHFVLGCHPGDDPVSFASGVGSRSMIPGYGVNRADESYIPGGIGSGTALIRPDYPELLAWPYLWQQTEYCVGNPTADYVFLIAAADHLLRQPD